MLFNIEKFTSYFTGGYFEKDIKNIKDQKFIRNFSKLLKIALEGNESEFELHTFKQDMGDY